VPHVTIWLAWTHRKDDVTFKINIISTLTSWNNHEATVVGVQHTPSHPKLPSQITWLFSQNFMSHIRWFLIDKNGRFFWKSNYTDEKRHCQLPRVPNFNPFQATIAKMITHLDAKTWKPNLKMDMKIGPQCDYTIQDIDRYKGPWLRKQQNFPPKLRSIIHTNRGIAKLQRQLTQVSSNQEKHTSLQKRAWSRSRSNVKNCKYISTRGGEEHTKKSCIEGGEEQTLHGRRGKGAAMTRRGYSNVKGAK
jgi:hypothetical protein